MTLLVALIGLLLAAQAADRPLAELPAAASSRLAQSLDATSRHATHVWRDIPPLNADGTVNAYVEISRGDRRKWEFDMRSNARAIDRVIPEHIGGYPVNYGYVPQTISYDGDPFDVLVLGPPVAGGTIVPGVIVGLMLMEDEKGIDSKVVVSPIDRSGRPLYELRDAERAEIGEYFRRYKRDEPGAFSTVPGWGSAAAGLAHVTTTHAFFKECRPKAGSPCRVSE